MAQATCDECGKPLTGRQRRYCSRLHSRRAYKREAQRAGVTWAQTSTYRNPEPLTCHHCGKDYMGVAWDRGPDRKHRYCSTECFATAKAWHYRTKFSSPLDWRDCNECGTRFISHANRSRCGECHVEKQRRWIGGPCVECGTNFIGRWHPEWPCRYCSDKCIKRVGRRRHRAKHGRMDTHRKRARHFGVAYEPIRPTAVFERDGYRCQICREPTLKSKRVPHSRAPTLDHIVPFNEGGPHLYTNVQCACFRCNSLKGDRAANDQLLLVG